MLIMGNGMLMCLYSMEWYARQRCPENMVNNSTEIFDYVLLNLNWHYAPRDKGEVRGCTFHRKMMKKNRANALNIGPRTKGVQYASISCVDSTLFLP